MGGTELTQYIIFAVMPKGKGVERRVIEGATSIKGARQKAYRAAKRYPEARYIGIQTIAKYHQPYSEITVKVRMGEDGKVYANRKELKSTGEFYTDRKKTKSEDIFAWYKGESPKIKNNSMNKEKAVNYFNKVKEALEKKTDFMTENEFMMGLSMDMRVMKYSEAKALLNYMVENGIVEKRDEFIRLKKPVKTKSSKFMRDHIIIAQPKPVKRAPTGFTWQAFNERFNHYYKEMYEGRLNMSREWVEKGDRLIQTKKEFVNEFNRYRQDIISSDRETAALARTYDYFQKKGMITNR